MQIYLTWNQCKNTRLKDAWNLGEGTHLLILKHLPERQKPSGMPSGDWYTISACRPSLQRALPIPDPWPSVTVWGSREATSAPQQSLRSVFIAISKKGNAKEYSNYRTTALISHASKVTLKFSKPVFSNMWTMNYQMFKLVLEKAEEPEIKLTISTG